MSLGLTLGEKPIADQERSEKTRPNSPSPRTTIAKADAVLTPEAR